RRWHPLLHVWRPHYGVDLAADIGTPIKAAGDGTIRRMVRGPGYGRLVTIKHFGPYSTRYAHLRRFAKGIHVGSRVHQGQVIGYVGESGEATGPHLHFEIRVDGKPKDPLHVALPDGTPVPKQQRAQFRASIAPLTAALEDPDRYSTPTALASLGLDHEAQNDAGEQQIARAGSDTP
ncbi:MAG: M23 family metallopeptidase, partial [Ectothiorhodospiraceae bacterium]